MKKRNDLSSLKENLTMKHVVVTLSFWLPIVALIVLFYFSYGLPEWIVAPLKFLVAPGVGVVSILQGSWNELHDTDRIVYVIVNSGFYLVLIHTLNLMLNKAKKSQKVE